MTREYSLGYVRGLADTHGSLHLISKKLENQRAVTFRNIDKAVIDELARHLDVLGYEYKRYVQSQVNQKTRKPQNMLRIHKQEEVKLFCEEVGFRRRDRAERAKQYLAGEIS